MQTALDMVLAQEPLVFAPNHLFPQAPNHSLHPTSSTRGPATTISSSRAPPRSIIGPRGSGGATNPQPISNLDKPVRACTNCVRAKARCTSPGNILGKCERCYRMKKDCQPSPPVRRRRAVTKRSAGGNRVEKLEEKLDGLVALLKTATQGASSSNSALEGLVPSVHSSSTGSVATPSSHSTGPLGGGLQEAGFRGSLSAHSSAPPGSLSAPPSPIPPFLEPSAEEANSYLDRFRREFIEHMPFLVVAESMTADQLRRDSPLLWLSIMTVASTQTTQQIALSKEIRAVFGREAYVEGTRNMDFLLAILVYTAWDRHYCLEKALFTSLVQLAIAVLYELGLDRQPCQDPGIMMIYEWKGCKKPSRLSRLLTTEDCRALLGCFLLSTVPLSLGRGDSLRWSTYCDECVRFLQEQKELPSDLLLIQLVRLRLIAGNAAEYPFTGSGAESSGTGHQMTVYLKSLQAQLRNFKSHIPPELMDNKVLLLEIHTTEFAIHSIAFASPPGLFPAQSNQRFEYLYTCLQAVKSWVDTFLTIPSLKYAGFSSLLYSNMMRCFIIIYRLAICDHPEWDQSLLHEAINVPWTLEETGKRFGEVKTAAGLDPGVMGTLDSFSVMESRLRSMKMLWEAMAASTPSFTPASLDAVGSLSGEFLNMWNW